MGEELGDRRCTCDATRGTLACLGGLIVVVLVDRAVVVVGTAVVAPVVIQTRSTGERGEEGEDGTTTVTGATNEEVATCGETAAIRIDIPNDDARVGDITAVGDPRRVGDTGLVVSTGMAGPVILWDGVGAVLATGSNIVPKGNASTSPP